MESSLHEGLVCARERSKAAGGSERRRRSVQGACARLDGFLYHFTCSSATFQPRCVFHAHVFMYQVAMPSYPS